MSDLASQLALTRTPTHLPLSWYFDPKVAEIEQKLLFDRGPGYVGHAAMAPEPGRLPRARLARARRGLGAREQRRAATTSSPTSAATARR